MAPTFTPKVLTLIYVRRVRGGASDVLLGYKKRGFGAGKWNGFGGKVDSAVDASVYESARREVREECGVEVPAEGAGDAPAGGRPYRCTPLRQVGRNLYHYDTMASKVLDVRVYETWLEEDEGAEYLVESDEMRPQWFAMEDVPIKAMWADDLHWLEQYLKWAPAGPSGQPSGAEGALRPPFLGQYFFKSHEGPLSEVIYRFKLLSGSDADVEAGFLTCPTDDVHLERMLAGAEDRA